MALPIQSISCCTSYQLLFFCKGKKVLAFNWNRCCHLSLCLQLILTFFTLSLIVEGTTVKVSRFTMPRSSVTGKQVIWVGHDVLSNGCWWLFSTSFSPSNSSLGCLKSCQINNCNPVCFSPKITKKYSFLPIGQKQHLNREQCGTKFVLIRLGIYLFVNKARGVGALII